MLRTICRETRTRGLQDWRAPALGEPQGGAQAAGLHGKHQGAGESPAWRETRCNLGKKHFNK